MSQRMVVDDKRYFYVGRRRVFFQVLKNAPVRVVIYGGNRVPPRENMNYFLVKKSFYYYGSAKVWVRAEQKEAVLVKDENSQITIT